MIPPLYAIYAFPLFALILFQALRPREALIWTILTGYLLLPSQTALNLPGLPPISKDTLPPLVAFVLLLVFTRPRPGAGAMAGARAEAVKSLPGWLPRSKVITVLLGLLFLGTFLTVATNGDRITYGKTVLPGLGLRDGISQISNTVFTILPLLLGRKFLADEDGQRMLLRAMVLAGAAYAILALYEIIMSPQLSNMIYGFFPHSWKQHIRGGSFRPVVFLKHGLWLGMLLALCAMAAFTYARVVSAEIKVKYYALGAWILTILMMSSTLGASIIALSLLPVVILLGVRKQMLIAAAIALCMLTYPSLRGADVVPTDRLVAMAQSIDANRGGSLQHRFNNEDALLARANERPLFGWGGWGRPRIFDEDGNDISTTDGLWVIRIGERGWVGYVGLFGLLCMPILLLTLRQKKLEPSLVTSGLCLILAANMIDMIPNAGLNEITMLIAGALVGRLEWQRQDSPEIPETPDIPTKTGRYSRFARRPVPPRQVRSAPVHRTRISR